MATRAGPPPFLDVSAQATSGQDTIDTREKHLAKLSEDGKRLFYAGRLRYEPGMTVVRYMGIVHAVTGDEPEGWLESWDAMPIAGDPATDAIVARQLREWIGG